MTRADLLTEFARLVEQLRPGGSQAHCESLRRKIAEVERALALDSVRDEITTERKRTNVR